MPGVLRSPTFETVNRFAVVPLDEDHAEAARTLVARAEPCGWRPGIDPVLLAQTGSRVLVALRGDMLAGMVRWWDDDGIAWLDLLAAEVPGAGRELVRAVGRAAQDAGLRLVRAAVPEDGPLPDYFGRLGYLPVGRKSKDSVTHLVLERRLPLLTVREQRRSDAAAIGELTGEDPWVFEQGARPGWFVAADGDTLIGVIGVRDAGAGTAELTSPALRADYTGRNLELWMLDRAALYAETNGFHTARVPASRALRSHQRELEDRRWFLEGEGDEAAFVRRFAGERLHDHHEEEWL